MWTALTGNDKLVIGLVERVHKERVIITVREKKKQFLLMMFLLCVFVLAGSAAALAITQDTDIEFTAPVAGDSVLANSTATAEYTLPYTITSGQIFYSLDNGTTWDLIGDLDPSASSYEWSVPNVASSEARLKLEVITWKTIIGPGGTPMPIQRSYYNISDQFTIFKIMLLGPLAPSDLTATAASQTQIDLTWQDNAGNETSFVVERRAEGETAFAVVATLAANVEAYSDTGLNGFTKYYYRVKAANLWGSSSYSDEASATTLAYFIPIDPDPVIPILFPPTAPEDLLGEAVSDSSIELTWEDTASVETGFKIERKVSAGTFAQIDTVGADVETYMDTDLEPETTYYYRVRAYNIVGDSDYSNTVAITTEAETTVTPPPEEADVEMRFYINQTNYYINDIRTTMDAAPVILNDRTLLPVRYVAEPLGAVVSWNGDERKVTITTASKIIELWIDNNVARVNGVSTFIDPANSDVKPVILPPGRTMLPLRFIAENLGCDVGWNGPLQEVTVTYTAP